jgi:hypothetical protein
VSLFRLSTPCQPRRLVWLTPLAVLALAIETAQAFSTPEATLRALVQANADRELSAMSRYLAHDVDMVGYSIGGRKYVGWSDLTRDMEAEFQSLLHLEIPIRDLKVWSRGDVAWFVMELDYIRYSRDGRAIDRQRGLGTKLGSRLEECFSYPAMVLISDDQELLALRERQR